jgi:hypothetical protein
MKVACEATGFVRTLGVNGEELSHLAETIKQTAVNLSQYMERDGRFIQHASVAKQRSYSFEDFIRR